MTIDQLDSLPDDRTPADADWDDGAPADYRDIKVRVALVIDGPLIPISDLPKLSVGQVIKLERPISDPELRIVVEGSTLARGRLVKVGDTIGVLIEKVKANS